jgi:uncharacterized BrkB/YihY/UPF0761 family membrane protein
MLPLVVVVVMLLVVFVLCVFFVLVGVKFYRTLDRQDDRNRTQQTGL